MLNVFPSDNPELTARDMIDAFTYRYWVRALIAGEVIDPSSIVRKTVQLKEGLLSIGVENERIAEIAAAASDHHAKQMARIAARPNVTIDPYDLAGVIEEPPDV